jgi:hypothetical protein
MKIEVPHNQLKEVQWAIRQFKLRHGPFYKLLNSYRIYLYPNKKLSLFLIKLSDTGLTVLE